MRLLNGFILFVLIVSLIGPVCALSMDVNVPLKYAKVSPGENVYFEIHVKYPENDGRKDLILEYELLNKDGKIVARSDTLKAIETQFSLLDSVVVPENAGLGLYSIKVRMKVANGPTSESGASFNVVRSGINWPVIFLWVFLVSGIIYLGFKVKSLWNRLLLRIKIRRIVRERHKGHGQTKNDKKEESKVKSKK